MAQLLKGLAVANALTEELSERVAALKAQNITPTLAILRVGERPDDISYETGAVKRCEKVGITVRKFLLAADCTKDELLNAVLEINNDPSISRSVPSFVKRQHFLHPAAGHGFLVRIKGLKRPAQIRFHA